MSTWHAYWAGWTALSFSIVATISFFSAAAWWADERFGGLGALFLLVSFLGGVGMSVWQVAPPRRPLPRNVRRRLRAEADRIHLEVEIKRMEKEAGL